MSDADEQRRPAQHILPTAGTMLGITTTLVGLVKIVEAQRAGTSHVDEIGGVVGALFMFSAMTSYASIRTDGHARMSRRLERVADVCFLLGLVSLAGLSLMFAYELL